MFQRKKPWANRGGGKQGSKDNKALENEYFNQSLDITSQYQSSREANSTIKGFLILCVFIVVFCAFMFGLMYLLNSFDLLF